ncbi:MAG: sulfatase-like hydrolase/transferase [Planctomycetota bacterium]|jgi:arylsulfatase A-like enzyme|nr:sulfatase-like hydrolase/transferase [Planctomycetota bacterium]
MTRPNCIVIMADQLRYDALGPHTPHINALLGESWRSQRSYCTSPLCVPARGSFFTGRHPNQTGCVINPWAPQDKQHGLVAAGTPNWYQLLEQDWDLWHTGKQHFLTEDRFDRSEASRVHWCSLEDGYGPHLKRLGARRPGGEAFRCLVPEMIGGTTTRARNYSIPTTGCYEPGVAAFFDGYICQTSLDAISQRDRSKPFALGAMFLAPHPPLDIPEPWFSRIAAEDVTLPDNVGCWSPQQSPLQLYNLPGFLGGRYEREQWREVWRVYLGLVALLDDCVGHIVAQLKAEGLYEESVIVFTADHGEMLGSHRLWQKMCMYEESVRTPTAIKCPASWGVTPVDSSALFSHLDVLPTLCDLLGVAAPADLPGYSAAAHIRDGAAFARERCFIQFDGNGARGNFQRCIIEGQDKLILDLFKDEWFIELYDVVADPQEQHNRALAEGPRCEDLLAKLAAHMQRTGDLLRVPEQAYATFVERYAALLA